MGDKVSAKDAMKAAGVPCVPVPKAPCRTTRRNHPHRQSVGYPVIIKAAAAAAGAACASCIPKRR